MIISERIFEILAQKNMTQKEFASRIGVANSTLSEWKKNKTNPSSDKIMVICQVLEITPEHLLTGKESVYDDDISIRERKIIDAYRGMKKEQQKRLFAYVEALKRIESLEDL